MMWASPERLYLLLLLLPAAWLGFAGLRRRERRLADLVDRGAWNRLVAEWRPERARFRFGIWLMAIGLALLALARPQWGFHWEEVRRRGLDLMVVIDTSKSMLAEDLKPNRLQQAKWGVRDLLRQLKGDRVGLVAFAGASFLQCPLTIDYAALTMTLDDLYAGIIPRGGTAIEQALRTAVKSFDASREGDGADRAIVLITDGDDHEGDPLKMLDELKERGIRLYAIGVGSPEGELIPAPDPKSDAGFVKDRDGKVVKSRLHEDVLKRLALGTGGAYVRSAPGDTGLDRVFRESIDQLKRDERESRMAKVHEDRYMWLLGAAWLLLLVEAVVTERRRTREEWTG